MPVTAMMEAIKYLKAYQWTDYDGRGADGCDYCDGIKPGWYEGNDPREGHKSDCPLVRTIGDLEDFLAGLTDFSPDPANLQAAVDQFESQHTTWIQRYGEDLLALYQAGTAALTNGHLSQTDLIMMFSRIPVQFEQLWAVWDEVSDLADHVERIVGKQRELA